MLLAVLAGLLLGCAGVSESWQSPEVTLVAVQPKALSLTHQVFLVRLEVKNPNDRTLPVQAMTYRLSLEGEVVATGRGELERQIPAQGSAEVEVEVVGDLVGLATRLPGLLQADRPLHWTISGTAALAGGLVVLPYSRSGSLDPQSLAAGEGRGG